MRHDDIVVVGITGRAYSGKTTASDELTKHGFYRYAFADTLKAMLIKAKLITYDECYVMKSQFARDIMQKVGTEIFRHQVDELYWLKAWGSLIKNYNNKDYWIWDYAPHLVIGKPTSNPKFVVDDIRFPNEESYLRDTYKNVFIIKTICSNSPLSKEMTQEQKEHTSESLIDSIKADHIIDLPYGNIDGIKAAITTLNNIYKW